MFASINQCLSRTESSPIPVRGRRSKPHVKRQPSVPLSPILSPLASAQPPAIPSAIPEGSDRVIPPPTTGFTLAQGGAKRPAFLTQPEVAMLGTLKPKAPTRQPPLPPTKTAVQKPVVASPPVSLPASTNPVSVALGHLAVGASETQASFTAVTPWQPPTPAAPQASPAPPTAGFVPGSGRPTSYAHTRLPPVVQHQVPVVPPQHSQPFQHQQQQYQQFQMQPRQPTQMHPSPQQATFTTQGTGSTAYPMNFVQPGPHANPQQATPPPPQHHFVTMN